MQKYVYSKFHIVQLYRCFLFHLIYYKENFSLLYLSNIMSPEDVTSVVLNVTFISAFIAVFFFTYGKIIEENVVKNQSKFIADTFAKDLSVFVDKPTALLITSQLSSPDMDDADKKAKAFNNQLQSKATYVVLVAFIIGLTIAIAISSHYELDFFKILKSNIVILIFVGITYYLFLTYFGQNFISADPNFVRLHILDIAKSKLHSDLLLPILPSLSLADASSALNNAAAALSADKKESVQLPTEPQRFRQSFLQTPTDIPQFSSVTFKK